MVSELKQREMGLLSKEHIGRMLIFEPEKGLCEGLKKIGAECVVIKRADISKIVKNKRTILKGLFSAMILGEVLEHTDEPIIILKILKSYLQHKGAITLTSDKYSTEQLIEMFVGAGYGDVCFDQLGKTWIARVQLKKSVTLWLQDSYTPELRKKLMYLLRRVDSGIEISKNAQAVWQLCAEAGITAEYLLPFIENTMLNPKRVLDRLSESVR